MMIKITNGIRTNRVRTTGINEEKAKEMKATLGTRPDCNPSSFYLSLGLTANILMFKEYINVLVDENRKMFTDVMNFRSTRCRILEVLCAGFGKCQVTDLGNLKSGFGKGASLPQVTDLGSQPGDGFGKFGYDFSWFLMLKGVKIWRSCGKRVVLGVV